MGLSRCLLAAVASLAWSHELCAQNQMAPPTRSEMAKLLTDFRGGHPPAASEVLGNWIMVRNVFTEQFLSGRDGPDQVLADTRGIRDSTAPHTPYWEMRVTRDANGKLIGASRTTWTGHDVSPMKFNNRGELTFLKETGGDSPYRYRCRMPTAKRLICIFDQAIPGHGVEFQKRSRWSSP
jgi:hypothetical protein